MGVFAVITPVLMTGAFADCFNFTPDAVVLTLCFGLCVCLPHDTRQWSSKWRYSELAACMIFADGIVVHVTAGFSAFAVIFVVGRRPMPDRVPLEDFENLKIFHLCAWVLPFCGLYGLASMQEVLAAGSVAREAAINTHLAVSTAVIMWVFWNG